MPEPGIVTRNDGPRFWVLTGGQEVPCLLRGKLKKEQMRVTSLVVVGDQVACEVQPDGNGIITAIEPRRSELARPGFHGYTHVIAANVDQLVIVQAALQPQFRRRLAERFLTIARRGRMEAVVVVNKADLVDEATILSLTAPLAISGAGVLLTSARDGRGLAELRERLAGRISVLAGQSGVGKSSLLNALYPEALARTTEVGSSNKGRHTTTASRLYPLPGGGYLADTPGIRQLELWDDDGQDEAVDTLFPEILAVAAGCKFRDCSHTHEPGCAVKTAITAGTVDQERFRDYLRLRGLSAGPGQMPVEEVRPVERRNFHDLHPATLRI